MFGLFCYDLAVFWWVMGIGLAFVSIHLAASTVFSTELAIRLAQSSFQKAVFWYLYCVLGRVKK